MVKTPIQGQKPEAAEAPSPSIPAVEARSAIFHPERERHGAPHVAAELEAAQREEELKKNTEVAAKPPLSKKKGD